MAEQTKKHPPLPGKGREVEIPTEGWSSLDEYEAWWREQGGDSKHSIVTATLVEPDGLRRRIRGKRVVLADPTGKDFQLRKALKEGEYGTYHIKPVWLQEEYAKNTGMRTHRIGRKEKVVRRYYTCLKNGDHFPLLVFNPEKKWFLVGWHRSTAARGVAIKRQSLADAFMSVVPDVLTDDQEIYLERLTNYEHREGESFDEGAYALYDANLKGKAEWDKLTVTKMYKEYSEVHDESREMFLKRLVGLELWLKTGKSEELRVPPKGHPRSMATLGEVALHFGGRAAIASYPVRRWAAIWANTNNGVLSRIRAGQGALKLTGTPEERWQQFQAHIRAAELAIEDRKTHVPQGVDDKTRLILNLTYWGQKNAGQLSAIKATLTEQETEAVKATVEQLHKVFVTLGG